MLNFILQSNLIENENFGLVAEKLGHNVLRYTKLSEYLSLDNTFPTYVRCSLDHYLSYWRKNNPNPGVCFEAANFKYLEYQQYWNSYLLNSNFIVCPISNLTEEWYNEFIHGDMFIRPNSGCKPFTGQTIFKYKDLKQIIDLYRPLPSELAILAPARPISNEARLVVGIDKDEKPVILAGSMYRIDGNIQNERINKDSRYWKFGQKAAEQVLEKYGNPPAELFTLDVCSERWRDELYIVELNSFGCAGLYDCEIEPIIQFMEKQWTA